MLPNASKLNLGTNDCKREMAMMFHFTFRLASLTVEACQEFWTWWGERPREPLLAECHHFRISEVKN
jgi:hypothetical protein